MLMGACVGGIEKLLTIAYALTAKIDVKGGQSKSVTHF